MEKSRVRGYLVRMHTMDRFFARNWIVILRFLALLALPAIPVALVTYGLLFRLAAEHWSGWMTAAAIVSHAVLWLGLGATLDVRSGRLSRSIRELHDEIARLKALDRQ